MDISRKKVKISETFEKITNPGRKRVWRVYDESGYAVADLLTMQDEETDFSGEYQYVDPKKPWKTNSFIGCTAKELQQPVMLDGKRVEKSPGLEAIRAYVKDQLEHEIWASEQRFENPHVHYLDMSPKYYALKLRLLEENR